MRSVTRLKARKEKKAGAVRASYPHHEAKAKLYKYNAFKFAHFKCSKSNAIHVQCLEICTL